MRGSYGGQNKTTQIDLVQSGYLCEFTWMDDVSDDIHPWNNLDKSPSNLRL